MDSRGKRLTLAARGTVNTVVANAIPTAGVQTGYAPRTAIVILDVTAAATDAIDTLDVFVDTLLGDVWVNAAHFTQLLGNGGAKREVLVINPGGVTGTTPVNVAADAASGTVRHLLGHQLRARYTTVDADADASWTFGVFAYLH